MALEDPVLRRQYVLDADIEKIDIAVSLSMPSCDSDGNIRPTSKGGRRRIDYIMYSADVSVV